MQKLTKIEKATMPQRDGYFISNRGNYIPVVSIPTKIKPNREQRIAARKDYEEEQERRKLLKK